MSAILINFAVENQTKTNTMKLKNIFMLLALAMGTFIFVACGDDEEQQPQDKGQVSQATKEVVGIYTGWTHLKTNFIDKNYDSDTLSLDITDDGILTKDNENNTRFISVSDFKKAYKNRLFFISDYSPLKKKYYVRDRDLNSYMVNNLFEFNGLSGEDVADLICAILEGINF